MKRFLIIAVLITLSLFAMAQKKVAVWETKCSDKSITTFQSTMVRGGMEAAVANAPGYTGYDRAAFDAIVKEQKFQRSGAVSDADIKKLGVMAGVQYIIVPEAMLSGNDFYIIVKMLDVETGEYGAAYDALCTSSASDIKKTCSQLGTRLFGNVSNSSSNTTVSGNNVQQGASTITITVGNVSFEMVKVEAGSFMMGCTSEQGSNCSLPEKPDHRVTISRDYYISKFEVTQELYEAVMGVNPSKWKSNNSPVGNVSWDDAQEFCAELSRMTGRRFTLPTEAEWEYAARGGKKSTGAKYSGSSSVANVAWYGDRDDVGYQTHPVGKLRPNELGIYDMSGNAWEWCLDWFDGYYGMIQTDPMGPASGSRRVLRGGSVNSTAYNCRVTYRNRYEPETRFDDCGFRVVLH